MKRAVLMLAVGLMGSGCFIETERDPSVTLRWELSRTVYDSSGRAASVAYDCEQAGIDYLDVWIVEPDGTRVSPAGSPFTCHDFVNGISIDQFREDRYEFDVYAYRMDGPSDLLLFDGTATAYLDRGDNTVVVHLVPYQGNVTVEVDFPAYAACPPGTNTLSYTLVDGYNTVVSEGVLECNPPYLTFDVDQHYGLDLDRYSIRVQAFNVVGATSTITYDSCTRSFNHLAGGTSVFVPMGAVSDTHSCPEDY